jgi:hypothetical protein
MNGKPKFKRNNLMNLKPALHPFDFTMTPSHAKNNRVSFAGGLNMSKYPSEKKFERSNTILDDNTILPPAIDEYPP